MLNLKMLPLSIQSKWEKEVHKGVVIGVDHPLTPPFPVSTLINLKKNIFPKRVNFFCYFF
jgi:hypothetical protein